MIRLNGLRRGSALVTGFSVHISATAIAQSTTVELPDIDPTATRLDMNRSPKPAPAGRIGGAPFIDRAVRNVVSIIRSAGANEPLCLRTKAAVGSLSQAKDRMCCARLAAAGAQRFEG